MLCALGQMNYIGTYRPLTPDAHQMMLAAAIAQLCCCCSCGKAGLVLLQGWVMTGDTWPGTLTSFMRGMPDNSWRDIKARHQCPATCLG